MADLRKDLTARDLEGTAKAIEKMDAVNNYVDELMEMIQSSDESKPVLIRELVDSLDQLEERKRAVCVAFAKDTASINPRLLHDVESGFIKPHRKMLDFARRTLASVRMKERA